MEQPQISCHLPRRSWQHKILQYFTVINRNQHKNLQLRPSISEIPPKRRPSLNRCQRCLNIDNPTVLEYFANNN